MENPDLRMAMSMKSNQKGVRIRRVDPTAPESSVLQSSDVILSFDGVDIANDGTVPFRHGERIGFSYLVSQKYTGDDAEIKILRDSVMHKFHVKLDTNGKLVPAHNKCIAPSYYSVAGLVFTAVSVPYLRSEYGKDFEYEAPVKLLDKLLHSMPQSADKQLVVVSQVLEFNGKPVKNLKSLAHMVEACEDEFMKFDLEYEQVIYSSPFPQLIKSCYAILVLVAPSGEDRNWHKQELEIIQVVADQVAVSISHAAVLEESQLMRDKLVEQNRALQMAQKNAMMDSQARKSFQRVMSNGMRKPMHTILGLLSLLQEDSLSTEQKLIIDTMMKTNNVLSLLINDVIDDSPKESGRFPSEIKSLRLHHLVKEAGCLEF